MKNLSMGLFLLTLTALGLFTVFAEPTQLHAAGLVPCGLGETECTFCDLVVLAMNVLKFLVVTTAIVATILFVNAGILYLFSGGNAGSIAKAHRIFVNTLIGFIVVLASYLVISLIMSSFYENSSLANLFTGKSWSEVITCPGKGASASTPTLTTSSGEVVAAGPGYTPGDFVTDPAYPTGQVLSDSALAAGLGNATTNCTAGSQTCTDFIIAQANAQGVDPNYALALAAVESGGCSNPATCTSSVGAVGVIQLMPGTARELCGASCASMSDTEMKTYLQDPTNNISLGVKYMAQSSDYVDAQMAAYPERFDPERKNDYMAAYYNGGATALQASADCGPTMTKYECTINPGGYVETQDYVDKMNTYVNSVDKATDIVGG